MNKKIALGIVVLVVLVIAVIGIVNMFGSSSVTENVVQNTVTKTGEVNEFNIKAFQWGYKPDAITVNKGDKVKITIDNTNTLHGIKIPELEVSGNNAVEFIVDETGEFVWYCNNYCGSGHGSMNGRLIVI